MEPAHPASKLVAMRSALIELAPVLRRSVALDPNGIARLRFAEQAATVLVRLPFDVLVSRTIGSGSDIRLDITVGSAQLLSWLDGEREELPQARDAEWRSGLPPTSGWRHLDTVPDHVVRDLVRQGALALKDAALHEGVPNAQPRAEVADALLDSVVLTVSGVDESSAGVTLRALSALLRMGFLPRDSHIAVATAGRWTRVAAEYGSVHAERPGLSLNLS
jgi:hypothetical protein